MAILNRIEVIPFSIKEEYQSDFPDAKVVFMPNSDIRFVNDNAVEEPNLHNSLWFRIIDYLSFPYLEIIEGDLPHLEVQIVQRIYTVYTYLDKLESGLMKNLLSQEIDAFLKIFREGKITVERLTKEDVEQRVTSKDYDVDYDPDGSIDLDVGMGSMFYFVKLKAPKSDYTKEKPFQPYIPAVSYTDDQDKFNLIYELGIINHLQDNWQWSENEDTMFENNSRFAKVLCNLFGFKNPDTIRTYLVRLKKDINNSSKYLSETHKTKVMNKLEKFGISPKE